MELTPGSEPDRSEKKTGYEFGSDRQDYRFWTLIRPSRKQVLNPDQTVQKIRFIIRIRPSRKPIPNPYKNVIKTGSKSRSARQENRFRIRISASGKPVSNPDLDLTYFEILIQIRPFSLSGSDKKKPGSVSTSRK